VDQLDILQEWKSQFGNNDLHRENFQPEIVTVICFDGPKFFENAIRITKDLSVLGHMSGGTVSFWSQKASICAIQLCTGGFRKK
jgi:hypothetical protein